MVTFAIFALFVAGVVTIGYGFYKHPPRTEWKDAIKNHDKLDEKNYIEREDKLRQNYIIVGMIIALLAIIIGTQFN